MNHRSIFLIEKKAVPKGHTMHDSIHMTFWKQQYCKDEKWKWLHEKWMGEGWLKGVAGGMCYSRWQTALSHNSMTES